MRNFLAIIAALIYALSPAITSAQLLLTGAGGTGSIATTTVTEILLPGRTNWRAPATFLAFVEAHAIGAGGNGAAGLADVNAGGTGYAGAAGGSGAWAKITTLTVVAGDNLTVQVGTGGSQVPTFLKDNGGTTVLSADYGRNASVTTGGAAGTSGASTGASKFSGAAGGGSLLSTGSRGGGGGAGAASPLGAGVAGTTAIANAAGRNGGASGGGVTGGAGGAAGNAGVAGGAGSEFTATDGATAGAGAGGGGGGSTFAGGAGGAYGAGGGGGGKNASVTQGAGGLGGGGVLVITYTAYVTTPPSPALYDIIVVVGDSLAAGRGTFDGTEADTPLVAQFPDFSGSGGLGGNIGFPAGYNVGQYRTITAATTRLIHPEGLPPAGNWYGPGIQFATAYASATGRRVLVVPTAFGGTTISSSWISGGTRRNDTIAAANAAIAAAKLVNPSSNVVGFFIAGGTNDANASVAAATFVTAYNDLIAGLRANVTGASEAWVVVDSMLPEGVTWTDPSHASYPAIDNATRQIVLLNARTTFSQGAYGDSNGDRLHFNRLGSFLQGSSGATAVLAGTNVSRITYDFVGDDPAVAPTQMLGLTDVSSAASTMTTVVSSTAQTGMTGPYLTTGGTFGANQYFGKTLECFQSTSTDQVVEWVDGFDASGPGRGGVTLRTQTATSTVGATAYGKQGYQFEVDRVGGSLHIYALATTTRTALTGTLTLSNLAGRMFRASAIGSTLTFSYSDNGGSSWTTPSGGSTTDTTYTAGQAAYGQWNGSSAGKTFVDNLVCKTAP